MQAIIWLKNPIEIAGGEISVIIADVISHTETAATITYPDGVFGIAPYKNLIVGVDVASALWVLQNNGELVAGVIDVRNNRN